MKPDVGEKPKRPAWVRALNAGCAVALLSSVIVMMIFGFHLAAVTALALSLAGVATPVVMDAHGVLEVVTGIIEALVDGVLAIIDGIVNAITGLFG